MPRRSLSAAVALLAVSVLTACGSSAGVAVTSAPGSTSSSADGVGGSTPASSSSASSQTTSATAAAKFGDDLKVGDCVDSSMNKWSRGNCEEPHEYEVSAVVANSEYPHDMAKRGRLRNYTCDKTAAGYLGGPIGVTGYAARPLPILEDTAAGSRIVCLVFMYNFDLSKPGSGPVRMKGDLARPARVDKSRVCWAHHGADASFCSAGDHVAESVSWVWLGKPGDPILSETTVASLARDKCAAPVKAYLGGVTRKDITAKLTVADDRSWNNGHTYGICYAAVSGAPVTSSVRGIGHKSLDDYR